MAADIFLKLGDIKGESMDSKHKGEIEILSWSWGATQTGSASRGGGMGQGKVEMQNIHFTKSLDKATHNLILNLATGKHIPTADLAQRKAGGEQKEYLKIHMDDVLISSYQTSANGTGEAPMETISLDFGKITIEYFEQDNKGTMTSAGKVGWDVKANQKV
jgi:type VI secretion system secreted protein Hcp